MTSRLVLPPNADRDTWLAARLPGVTGSEIAAILGISPFESAFNLYWQKTGAIPQDFDNNRLSLGRHLEPWIADRFAESHPDCEVAIAGLFQSVERPWQMATPDRLLDVKRDDGTWVDGVLEVKTSGTYEGWGEDGTDEIPAYIRAQVLWQEDVIGVDTAYVSCLFLATQQIRTYVVPYDPADVELMRKAATEFLDRIARAEPPGIDAHTATTAALKRLHPSLDDDAKAEVPADLAARYRAAYAASQRADEDKQQAENELRAAMGDAKRAIDPDGGKVATRSIYDMAGLDRDLLRKDWPDAWAECRTTTTVDKLTASRPKKGSAA